MEVTSTRNFFVEASREFTPAEDSMKASMKVTSTEAFTEASTEAFTEAFTEASTKAFVEVNCVHGSFRGSK